MSHNRGKYYKSFGDFLGTLLCQVGVRPLNKCLKILIGWVRDNTILAKLENKLY